MKYLIHIWAIWAFLGINYSYCFSDIKVVVRKQEDEAENQENDPKQLFNTLKQNCDDLENEETIMCLMNAFLQVYDFNPDGFCDPDDNNCRETINNFSERCSGHQQECIILDNITLFQLSGEDILVPQLPQVEVSNYVFVKSGARRPYGCQSSCVRAPCSSCCCSNCDYHKLRCENPSSDDSFNKILYSKNVEKMNLTETSEIGELKDFLYYACIYYITGFIYKDDGQNWLRNRNLNPALRYMRSYGTRKKFSKMRRNGKLSIRIAYTEIKNLFERLVEYLTQNPPRKHRNMALSYAKVFKHTIVKAVPLYKHSYLFAQYLEKNTINTELLCDPYSPNGSELFKSFLERCKEGECYDFDDYKLFDEDEEPNYLVPNLSEVNLVFYLLKRTNFKYGALNSLLSNTTRPHTEIRYMGPRLLEVNRKKFDGDETHKIIQAYVYFCAIFFVKTYRETWLTRGARHIANWDVEPKLKNFLLKESKENELVTYRCDLEKIFRAFKQYLLNSYFRNHPNRVKRFTKKMRKVLMDFYETKTIQFSCCTKPWPECS